MAKNESTDGRDPARLKKVVRMPRPKAVTMTLEYFAPEANTVAVAGEFNNWNEQAQMMKKTKAGWWKTSLKLSPGQYQYRFVVDGQQWVEDPENPNKQLNEFAAYNSVLEVR